MNLYEQTPKFRNFIQTGVYNTVIPTRSLAIDKISLPEFHGIIKVNVNSLHNFNAYSVCLYSYWW